MHSPTLLSIIAHARSGALEHAWRLFREGGFEDVTDDPAVLSVRGRLLKDRALSARSADRAELYRRSAVAYMHAGKLSGASYPLINAATLSLLAGDGEQARTIARALLDRSAKHEDETPYYRGATRAEALLLLGRVDDARAEFGQAIALAPKAYEDHASTLRQFGLILESLGQDSSWLDFFRPPRALHFAGHMAPTNGDDLTARIRAVVKDEKIGFGFGALAAGADILIAEALLEAGAELHLVLSASLGAFREACVVRFGGGWPARFDRIVEAAQSVRSIAGGEGPLSPLALRLAGEIAMGQSVMQADLLATEAVQLLIVQNDPRAVAQPGGTEWIGSAWKKAGRRQIAVAAPRSTTPDPPVATVPRATTLAAVLRIDVSGIDEGELSTTALPSLGMALARDPIPSIPPRFVGDAVLVGFDSPVDACLVAHRAAAMLTANTNIRIAAHYAILHLAVDPFAGNIFPVGPAMSLLDDVSTLTPRGAVHATEDFASALSATGAGERLRIEFVGEVAAGALAAPIRLFAVKC